MYVRRHVWCSNICRRRSSAEMAQRHRTGLASRSIYQCWSCHRARHDRLVSCVTDLSIHPGLRTARDSLMPLPQILTLIFLSTVSQKSFHWKGPAQSKVCALWDPSHATRLISCAETVQRVSTYIESIPELRHNRSKLVEGWGWDHTKWLQTNWPAAVRPLLTCLRSSWTLTPDVTL